MWTDDKEFANSLIETSKKPNFDMELIRTLLESYFTAVKNVISHEVPKIIMTFIIREIEKSLLPYFLHNVVSEDKIGLLKEDENIEKQRKYYSDLKLRINNIKKAFSKSI